MLLYIWKKGKGVNVMRKEIWFDMDGTIANLYGVENWLEMIINENPMPYEIANPMVNMNSLARILNRLQKNGYKIGIISWLAKNGSENYNEKVTQAKKNWLAKHLASVKFDKIEIVEFGTPKENGRFGILFDDEIQNRENWNEIAYNEKNIIEILKAIH
jgi:hypothetical protein